MVYILRTLHQFDKKLIIVDTKNYPESQKQEKRNSILVNKKTTNNLKFIMRSNKEEKTSTLKI